MASFYDDSQDGPGGGRAAASVRRRPRQVTDYGSSLVQWMRQRKPRWKGSATYEWERPSISYVIDMLPPAARLDSPADAIPVRHLHSSLGKSKKPITVVRWMPEGRRLLTGVHNGEFMLWNGMAFNFETVMAASGYSSIRAAEWSNSKEWLLSSDDEGVVKYWQPNLNNVQTLQAHSMPVRDLAFAPSDRKFVTASDDAMLKIFDFTTTNCDTTLQGHNWDVKSVDWHPSKGLIVSGSKDHSVKLWDPRSGRNLTTLHSHKNALTATIFSRLRDQLLATAGRDNLARIFDLRMMRDVCILRGHEKGITAVAWHPVHSSLIATGSDDGSLHSYLLDEPNPPVGVSVSEVSPYNVPDHSNTPAQSIYPAHRIAHAHDSSIWSLDWHPLGHILASGSNDHFTRFWSRARPGETNCFKDQYHLGEEGAEAQGTWDRKHSKKQMREQEEQEEQDEAEGLDDQSMPSKLPAGIPGLPVPSHGGPPSLIPGMGSIAPPPQLPAAPLHGANGIGGLMDSTRLAGILASTGQNRAPSFLPPPPPASLPPNLDLSKLQLPPGFQIPAGFPPPPPPVGAMPDFPALMGMAPGTQSAAELNAARRRAPLPSQSESLAEQQRMGNYKRVR